MKTRKLLALCLSLVLALGLVVGLPAFAEEEAAETVTITYLPNNWGDKPTGLLDDPVTNEITRLTGVKFDIFNVGAAGDPAAKVAALMATDSLPDIVALITPEITKSGMMSGQFAVLDDLIEEFGPNIKANVGEALEHVKTTSDDGKIYYMPRDVGTFDYSTWDSPMMPFARWDLYEQIGAPEAETIFDYIDIVKQMLELEPTNDEGKTNYGFSIGFGGGPWDGDWNIWGGPGGMHGMNVNNYSCMNMVGDESNLMPMITDVDSVYHKMIRFWYEANQAGILDPDSFTMKGENAADKFKEGRVMMAFASWNASDGNNGFSSRGVTDKGYTTIPFPKDMTSSWISSQQKNGTPFAGIAVSDKSEYKEEIMKLLDFANSYDGVEIIRNGIEGVHWHIVDGTPYNTPERVIASREDVDYGKKQGLDFLSGLTSMGGGSVDPRYPDTTIRFGDDPSAVERLPIIKRMLEYYDIKQPLDLLTKKSGVEHLIANWWQYDYLPIPDDDMQDLINQVDSYIFTNYISMITAKDEADFEAKRGAFIDGAIKAGYETTFGWYVEQQDKIIAEHG